MSSKIENVLKNVKHEHRFHDAFVLQGNQGNHHFSRDDQEEEYIFSAL